MNNILYMFIIPCVWVIEPEVQYGGGSVMIVRTVRRVSLPGSIDPTIKNLQ